LKLKEIREQRQLTLGKIIWLLGWEQRMLPRDQRPMTCIQQQRQPTQGMLQPHRHSHITHPYYSFRILCDKRVWRDQLQQEDFKGEQLHLR
jgi:hypothetical protein